LAQPLLAEQVAVPKPGAAVQVRNHRARPDQKEENRHKEAALERVHGPEVERRKPRWRGLVLSQKTSPDLFKSEVAL
jgi:hypothetical protein